jgi:fibronectin-binding autotransporter adhesin
MQSATIYLATDSAGRKRNVPCVGRSIPWSKRTRGFRAVTSAAAACLLFSAGHANAGNWLPSAGGQYLWTPANWSNNQNPDQSDGVAVLVSHSISGPQTISTYDQNTGTGPTLNEMIVGGAGAAQTFVPVSSPEYDDFIETSTLLVAGNDASGGSTESQFQMQLANSYGHLLIESQNYLFSGTPAGSVSFSGAGELYCDANMDIVGTTVDLSAPCSNGENLSLDAGGVMNIRSGGSLYTATLTLAPTAQLNYVGVNQQFPATSSIGSIVGSGTIGASAGGTITLASAVSGFTGTFSASNAGVISITSDSELGAASVNLNGGSLQTSGSFTLSHVINDGSNEGIINTTSGTLTAGGVISGGGLLKQGAGTLVLANSGNNFNGLFLIGGTTQFSSDADLGASGASIGLDGGTLELLSNNNVSTGRSIGIGFFNANGTIDVDSNSTLSVQGPLNDTYTAGSGTIGGLIVEGTGTLALSGNNSYHGTTTIAGNLSVSSDTNLGATSSPLQFSDTVVISHGLIDVLAGTLYSTANFTMSNRPIGTGSYGGAFDVAPGTTLTVPGVISGSGSITKQNTGTLILTADNTFSGGLQINNGTLVVRPTTNINTGLNTNPLGTSTVTLNGGTLSLLGVSNPTTQQALAANGFNADVVVEQSSSPANAKNNATAFDPGGQFAFYEAGYAGHTTGLPNNHTFVSGSNPNVSFTLQSYTANNALLLTPNSTGILNLNDGGEFSTINFLAAAASGPASTNVSLNFADGTHATSTVSVADWFTNTTGALVANGRVYLPDGTLRNEYSGYPQLYEYDVTVPSADTGKVLNSVSFTPTSGETVGIFALSGYGTLVSPQQTYSNSIDVTADSTLNLGGTLTTSSLGSLTQGSNTLFVTGANGSSLSVNNSTLTGTPTFDVAPNITVNLGTASVSGGIVKNNGGTLELNGNVPGPVFVNGGSLIINGTVASSSLTVGSGGVFRLAGNGIQNLSSLNISKTGMLDVGGGGLMLSYAPGADPIASIAAMIQNGYSGGNWDGFGITSSQAQLNSGRYGIGYADSADPGNPAGLPSGTLEVVYTLLGDTNLDHKVNGTDFAILASDFNQVASSWDQSDFNYDGKANGTDFAYLAANFNQGTNQSDTAALIAFAQAHGLMADVPEPASVATLLAATSMSMLHRRRRQLNQSQKTR